MAGGLINLTYYGTQDILLTGNPQITFFKTVYRRHTNFAIESMEQEFLGKNNFGQSLSLTILKNGDLINKMYLRIVLPNINLIKSNVDISTKLNTTTIEVNDITTLNTAFKNYAGIIMSILRSISIALSTNNRTFTEISNAISLQYFIPLIKDNITYNSKITLIEQNSITQLKVVGFETMSLYTYYQTKLTITADYMKTRIASLFDFLNNTNPASLPLNFETLMNLIDIQTILYILTQDTKTSQEQKLVLLKKDVNTVIYNLKIMNTTILSDKYTKEKLLASLQDGSYVERYKFAWVKQIGHAIIRRVTIEIGGQKINEHTGDYMAIWHELTRNKYQDNNYDKMIGNITELYDYNDKEKPEYILLIPLQFWFCRTTASSLPLINLTFHDVKINVELRDVEECCYVEASDISFFNMVKIYNIELKDVTLYTDYIFLDSNERKRFAQSSHEYLVEQVQYNTFDNVMTSSYLCDLSFNHPTKEIFWTARKNINLINANGTKECLWTTFSYNGKNTIDKARLDFNSFVRAGTFDGAYFNYIQPYQSHRSIPSNGVNIYSFALYPEEGQPSGSCNFSKIDSAKLNLVFTQELSNSLLTDVIQFDTQNGLLINVYAVNLNVLRFIGGMAGLAFSIV